MSQIKFAATALALAAGLAIGGAANAAITLNTTGSNSNATFTFSTVAVGQMGLVNVKVAAADGSNTTLIGVTPTVDAESGLTVDVPSFNMPVTKASFNVGWDLKISPVSGEALRSALILSRPAGRGQPDLRVALANFRIDFAKQVMNADVFTSAGANLNIPLYNFTDDKNTKLSLVGVVVRMTGTISNFIFEDATADIIGNGLNIADRKSVV